VETTWFYVVGQERRGPVTEGELKQLLVSGRIAAGALVWCEGMAEWAPANTIAAFTSSAVPPLPQPGSMPPLPTAIAGPRFSRTHNRDLMAAARRALQGRWTNPVIVALVYLAISSALNLFGQIPIIGLLFLIASLLVGGALELGLTMYFLAFSRGGNPEVAELFSGFRNFANALAAYLLIVLFVLLWSLLLVVPGIIAAIRYSQTFFLLADNPNLGALDAIRCSKGMMTGNKWKFFCLGWRFFGWMLLCILTCGIGTLWLLPYLQVSFSKFYDDLKPAGQTSAA